ncbi:Basic-leucine zipper transcription factor [Heracleum sosnowskyi]|uniref:Basic-leucine zipper transcription factor n=1 Tax=Heracleum sosnowskyi TaxID=360622 RepID=A0AAD8M8R7_9APIA|nr:Basic-leucine zipper transcription factor [Heracleum sosnowskyi]
MLSAIPASSDGIFGSQLPTFFEGGVASWDCQELLPFLHHQNHEPLFSPTPTHEPVHSNSGSVRDELNATQKKLNHCEPNRKRKSSESGSDDPTQVEVEERKQRRMISNRESARRSRMRKQKHLENLRNQVKRFKIGNRDMMNRLHTIILHSQVVRLENERLQVESVMLQQKLWDMRQILHARLLQQQLSSPAWPCNNNVTFHQ